MQNARASSSRQHPSSARLAIHSFPFPSTLVGAALSLLLASPVLAAPSLPAPCNATGALENSMGGCATPPAPPASKTPSALSHETADFTAPEKFWIKTGKSGQEKTIRRNIVAWVAKRVVPHPSASESALLNAAILRLSASSFPMVREAAGPDLFAVTVDTKTLNRIAARLRRSVSSGRLAYRVNRTAVTGGSPGENRFVERSLPIPPSGVVDAQEVSNSLYQVSQVPGFVRADALFSPAVGVKRAGTGAGRREGRFDRPVTFTIKSDQTSLREIRRLIALYVGKRVLDMSTRAARAIVRKVADTASSLWWQPMEIVFGRDARGRIDLVTVAPGTLENLKNALLEMARTGAVSTDTSPSPALSTSAILSADALKIDLSGEPPQPTTGEIFAPASQSPDFENLLVNVTPAPTFAGSQIEIDNYGYAPTGALMLNATGNVNNAGVAQEFKI